MNKVKSMVINMFVFLKTQFVRFYNLAEWFLLMPIRTDLRNHVPIINNADVLTILANGPSLKKDLENKDIIKGDICVVNDFYYSPFYKEIRPKYHVLSDPLYFRTQADLEPFVAAIEWDIILFVPYCHWKKLKFLKSLSNSHITVIPFHSGQFKGSSKIRNYLFMKGLTMPPVYNVLVASLCCGINMGYKEINIYGADHSWTKEIRVDNNNRVCLTNSHFYDETQASLSPWLNFSGEPYRMHEILRNLAYMFDSYYEIREYAEYRNCKILNCTKDSFIDAFERKL